MTYFLERIASHLLDEYGGRLENQCLVFPNRRAGLYFMKYLASMCGKPVWAPAVKTINELFSLSSPLQIAENETLIFELYKVYKELNPEAESFDEFYFWGDMIINDFDDVDKYLADASKLFYNLADLKRIDKIFGELTEDQVKIIRQFWINFNAGSPTKAKAGFLGLWSLLPEMYEKYREALAAKGIAYEGMVFRHLAEECIKGNMPDYSWETFHFIGFNALNNCERSLLKAIRQGSKARFYWDYDEEYLTKEADHSAGYFIKANLRDFGNDMPSDWNYSTYVSNPGAEIKRRIIDTSSDIAQVKLIPQLLNKLDGLQGEEAGRTAIILADENLLVPILSTIPDTIEDVNITMGYPLKFSPVYSLIRNLLSLQINCRREGAEYLFNHGDVINILRHSYFAEEETLHSQLIVTELIKEERQWIPSERLKTNSVFEAIFNKPDDHFNLPTYIKNILELVYIADNDDHEDKHGGTANKIRNEFIYRVLLVLNRIDNAITGSDIKLASATWSRLLDKVLRGISIPFSGEPLKGIQVMGILETRSLDFHNLIILSVNEGILPGSSAGSSYIPYNLREAFGLPTIRHQDSIYAYYFYRLLHRSENVTFVYNSNSDGLRTGEMSRFLLQLKYLDKHPPDFSGASFRISAQKAAVSRIPRNEKHIVKMQELFLGPEGKYLSPSAVNCWLYCRMKFFYRYICGLREPERIITDIDPAFFGELLHSIMERIYSPFTGRPVPGNILKSLSGNENEILNVSKEVIAENFHESLVKDFTGNVQLVAGILSTYVKHIIRKDSESASLMIMALEKNTSSKMEINADNKKFEISAGGFIDRLDRLGSSYRIIDYKTGSVPMEIRSVDSLFDENDEKRNEAWFQILMYCEILNRTDQHAVLIPSVYAVRNLTDPGFSGLLTIKGKDVNEQVLTDYGKIRNIYNTKLEDTIGQMFSRNSDFYMTDHLRKCEYCPYRKICTR